MKTPVFEKILSSGKGNLDLGVLVSENENDISFSFLHYARNWITMSYLGFPDQLWNDGA